LRGSILSGQVRGNRLLELDPHYRYLRFRRGDGCNGSCRNSGALLFAKPLEDHLVHIRREPLDRFGVYAALAQFLHELVGAVNAKEHVDIRAFEHACSIGVQVIFPRQRQGNSVPVRAREEFLHRHRQVLHENIDLLAYGKIVNLVSFWHAFILTE
jgi:hypothetical protein